MTNQHDLSRAWGLGFVNTLNAPPMMSAVCC